MREPVLPVAPPFIAPFLAVLTPVLLASLPSSCSRDVEGGSPTNLRVGLHAWPYGQSQSWRKGAGIAMQAVCVQPFVFHRTA